MTSTFGQFTFQSKQRKENLLGPYGTYFEGFKSQSPMPSEFQSPLFQSDFRTTSYWEITESEEEQEEEEEKFKDQEFTYQNPILKNLEKFTEEEDDAQIWLNNVEKAITANGWNDTRALQIISYFLQDTANLWYQSLTTKPQTF
ncbi:hypothetical protein G9A89_010349 [Geosiphon pyriformis]|nr:hypothetical protein G9A89_010349 [Geosiphon pyriformis]